MATRRGETLVQGEGGRWLEMAVEDDQGVARIGGPKGDGEPFPFSVENLGYVVNGIGYQAWGGGSHFVFRRDAGDIVVEFQSAHDRGVAVCRMSREDLQRRLGALGGDPPSRPF